MVLRILFGFIFILTSTFTPDQSARADDASDCQGTRSEAQIKGCSAIIKSGRLFGKQVSTQGLVVAYNNRASAYVSKGDFTRAIADYTKAIGLDPKFAQAYFNRGIAHSNQNSADKAIADYDKTISLNPRFTDAYNNRGLAYHFKGDYSRAITDYDKAIRINPKYATAYNNRGDAYEKKGNLDKASSDYNMALSLDPSHKAAHYNLKQLKSLTAAKNKQKQPQKTAQSSSVNKPAAQPKTVQKPSFKAGEKSFSVKIDSLKKASWQRLGLRVASLTKPLAQALGINETRGALIVSLTPSGPAHIIGLHPGDVLLRLDGQDLLDQKYPSTARTTTQDQAHQVTIWRAAKTPTQLFERLNHKASARDSSAMYMLAFIHERGIGMNKDKGLAFNWMQKAANGGDPLAMSELGAKYAYGQGTSKDDEKALSWYKKAAGKGNARAMNSLGFMYSVGRGTPKDLRQAASWFSKAADKGNLSASFNLARAYSSGKGIKKNDKTAARYIIKTLRGGHATAVKQMSGNAKAWSIPFRRELQRLMKSEGLYNGLVNGKFGPDTQRAIRNAVNSLPTKTLKQTSAEPTGKTMLVLYPELHIFSKPNLQAPRTGSLFKGDKVVIKQWQERKSGKWAKVCTKKKNLCGWVGADFLEDTPL
ncbi:MAG: tetratricopeptide repeat protein [bacterium]|nr:tetratricopeptide repeat protein [bacterium]